MTTPEWMPGGGGEDAVEKDVKDRHRALDEQIRKLKALRDRWKNPEALSPEELSRQSITLELFDGAIEDLENKRREEKSKNHV